MMQTFWFRVFYEDGKTEEYSNLDIHMVYELVIKMMTKEGVHWFEAVKNKESKDE